MKEIEVIYLQDAIDFLVELPEAVRGKIAENITLVRRGFRNSSLFKKLSGSEIWEFRTEYGNGAYRLLAFWDKEERSLVVATHGFAKKTQKTPQKEIKKAERIRQEYYQKFYNK